MTAKIINMFGLSAFAFEVLMQIYFAEIMGQLIREGHGWITARGNSICVIQDELIPRGLVKKDNGEFSTRDKGREVVVLVQQESVRLSQTPSSKIDKKILGLRAEQGNLPTGSQRSASIILEIHYLQQDKVKIIKSLGEFKPVRIDSYGQAQKLQSTGG